uniref:Uncharacterized protein n=1 Tax=Leersia perrieri TaxID=77586 RepID=A0A0D9XZU0_9ORYZ
MASSNEIIQGQHNRHAKAKRYICYDFYIDEKQGLKLEPDVELIGQFVARNKIAVLACTKGRNRQPKYSMPFNSCPKDMKFPLMTDLGRKSKEAMYSIHSSLTLLSDRSWDFIQMYEHIKFKIPIAQKEEILLKLPYVTIWRTTMYRNSCLLETYTFQSAAYIPLNMEGNQFTERQNQIHEAELMLDLVRNGISHRLQKMKKVTTVEHENILIGWFPLLLPHMQEAIHDVLGEQVLVALFSKGSYGSNVACFKIIYLLIGILSN